jgi:hypothetical protein
MIEREQHGIKSISNAFNTQWINDLKAVFGTENVTTANNVTTVTIADGLSIKSTFSPQSATYSTTVRLHYGGTNLTIATSSSSNYMAYRLIKFDNGVTAFTGFQTAANAGDLDAHTNSKRLIWFFADCTNVSTSATQTVAFKATASDSTSPDNSYYYTVYTGDSSGEIVTNYANVGTDVINAPMTILTPAFVRSLPLISDKLWIKMQSQEQYNTITMNGDQYLSCATFCVPLEV